MPSKWLAWLNERLFGTKPSEKRASHYNPEQNRPERPENYYSSIPSGMRRHLAMAPDLSNERLRHELRRLRNTSARKREAAADLVWNAANQGHSLLKDPVVIRRIIELAKREGQPETRGTLIQTLGEIGHPHAIPMLEYWRKQDKNETNKKYATDALNQIQEKERKRGTKVTSIAGKTQGMKPGVAIRVRKKIMRLKRETNIRRSVRG